MYVLPPFDGLFLSCDSSPHIIVIMADGILKVNLFPTKLRQISYCLQSIND